MGHLIESSFIPDLRSAGNLERMLTFEADAGDTIFINSSPKRSEQFFEVLCGLRVPDAGTVLIDGIDPYTLTPDQGAAFRRENIGAIPQGLGWIPELRMIEQIAFPMADILGNCRIRCLFRYADTGKNRAGKAKFRRRICRSPDGRTVDLQS